MHDPVATRMLDLAARHAWRGFGDVEPNPMVGAVIVREGASGPEVVAIGHHRVFGGLHAEREAMAAARARGAADLRGMTMYVTLEPCAHHGKQPPCVEAIVEAGIAAGEFRKDLDIPHLLIHFIGLCFIYHSNRFSLSQSLNLDLGKVDVKKQGLKQVLALVFEGISKR